jgi:hypothetical protein
MAMARGVGDTQLRASDARYIGGNPSGKFEWSRYCCKNTCFKQLARTCEAPGLICFFIGGFDGGCWARARFHQSRQSANSEEEGQNGHVPPVALAMGFNEYVLGLREYFHKGNIDHHTCRETQQVKAPVPGSF